jgi:hypothetical protein
MRPSFAVLHLVIELAVRESLERVEGCQLGRALVGVEQSFAVTLTGVCSGSL